MNKRNKSANKRNRFGAVATEFAIVLPLLLATLFAFYEISLASMVKHATQASAYEGARAGIIPGATEAEITNQVGFVLSSVGVDKFTVNVEQDVTIDDALQVRVTVNVPYTATVTGLFGANSSFTGQTTLSQESL